MIIGTGIDICQVDRIARVYELYGEKFARRILAGGELLSLKRARYPVKFLAMRFAAKEAASKALGTGFKQGISPRLIEVTHNPAGKPSLHFHGAAQVLAQTYEVVTSHVSMSDEQDYAVAFVVLEAR